MTRAAILLLMMARLAWAASAPSTTHLWSPVYPTTFVASAFPTANDMRCNAWVPEQGLTSATRIAWSITSGLGGGALCTLTVYDDTGSNIRMTTGGQNCSASGALATTGLSAFTFVEGDKYQVCVCATATGGSYATGKPSGTILTDMENAFSGVPLGSTAANPCSGGTAPSTTGTLTPAAVNPPIVLFESSTP